jgi:predicted MFS family arabinose efflux permease
MFPFVRFGRRPVFLLALALLITGRGLSVVSAAYYPLYLFTVFLGHSGLTSLSFAATTIGKEKDTPTDKCPE